MTDTTLGPWSIRGTLGQGGMGVVYRAVHSQGGDEVALKTTRHGSPDEVSRIRSEIHALAGINHAGVVRLMLHGTEQGVPWYAMELLQGRTLRVMLRALWPGDEPPFEGPAAATPKAPAPKGESVPSSETWSGADDPGVEAHSDPLPSPPPTSRRPRVANGRIREVLTLFYRLCAPLAAIHGRGLVHRDLKPENVFLRPDSTPVLMDLGLVAQARGAIGREKLDEGGRVLGTVAYMAPEQAEGLNVDARADLYALGAMLYEALTGQRTVDRAGNLQDVLARVRTEPPRPIVELVEGVPGALADLLAALLAKDPRQRIGHADDVARVLASCGADTSSGAVPDDAPAYLYRPGLRGRHAQRLILNERVEALKAGKGAVVVLAGESGSGKTFLATEAATLAGKRRIPVVTGECLPIEAGEDSVIDVLGAPLHPFRKFLQGCADRARQLGPEFAAELLGKRARVLAPYEPSLASTTAFQSTAPPEAVPAGVARDRVVAAMKETLAAWVRAEGPLLLVLDDLQWTDELSFSVLRALDAEFLAQTALLVLVTWRSDEVGPSHEEFAQQAHVERLALGRLEKSAVGEMVGDMLAMQTAPALLVDFVAKETEGNPFFVAEYLRMAAAERLLRREAGRWVVSGDTSIHRLPPPGSLSDLLARRLGGLSASALRVLDVAAVLGRHVRTATLLGALASIDDQTAIAELEARQVLEIEETGWRFVHDKLRETAFARVPPDRRAALHRAAAEALEAERAGLPDDAFEWAALGRHWQGAGEPGRAVRAWVRAGEQALRNFSNREAQEAYGNALELAEAAGATQLECARWQAGLADACILSGQSRLGMEHEASALAHLGHPLPASTFGWTVGFLWQIAVRVTQAYVLRPFKVSAPAQAEQVTLAAHCASRLLEPYFLSNQPIQGCYVGLRSINLAERTDAAAPLVRGLGFMAMLVGATPMRGVADRWVARSLSLAESAGLRENLIYVLQRTSCYDVAMGRWESAIEKSRRARDLAREIGDRRGFEESHTTLAQAENAMGRLFDGLASANACVEAAAKAGDKETMAMGLVLAMDGAVRTGVPNAALAAYSRALPDIAMHGEGIQAYFHAVAAEARLQLGDQGAARKLADEAVAILKKTPPASYFAITTLVSGAQTYLGLHIAAGNASDLAGAETMAAHLVALARMYPYCEPARDRVLAEIALRKGKPAKALPLFRSALAAAERLRMAVEVAEAHAALSRHAPEGERAEHATAAYDAFAATGAQPWVAALE